MHQALEIKSAMECSEFPERVVQVVGVTAVDGGKGMKPGQGRKDGQATKTMRLLARRKARSDCEERNKRKCQSNC